MRGDAIIQQSRNEADKMASVSIPVINFVDREFEKERLLTSAERERLREVIMEKFEALGREQSLAYVELQRRLDVLNHNHEEMTKRNAYFLPRENFEQFFKDFGTWRDSVNAAQNNQAGRMAAYAIGIIIIFGLLNLISHYWH
jgi:hypothetical protein